VLEIVRREAIGAGDSLPRPFNKLGCWVARDCGVPVKRCPGCALTLAAACVLGLGSTGEPASVLCVVVDGPGGGPG